LQVQRCSSCWRWVPEGLSPLSLLGPSTASLFTIPCVTTFIPPRYLLLHTRRCTLELTHSRRDNHPPSTQFHPEDLPEFGTHSVTANPVGLVLPPAGPYAIGSPFNICGLFPPPLSRERRP
jgi:hypothetical protein